MSYQQYNFKKRVPERNYNPIYDTYISTYQSSYGYQNSNPNKESSNNNIKNDTRFTQNGYNDNNKFDYYKTKNTLDDYGPAKQEAWKSQVGFENEGNSCYM